MGGMPTETGVRMTDSMHRPGRAPLQGSDGWHAEYIAVLDVQRGLYVQLDELSVRQGALIGGDDVQPLLDLLEERQTLIDQLLRSSVTVEKLRTAWESCSPSLPQARRDEVSGKVADLARLAAQVSLRDDSDHANLKTKLDAVAAELAEVATSRRAVSAYGGVGAAPPKFQDREG